ncbi:MAG: hypothetical protein ABW026_16125 [Microvirga sp.]
MAQAIIPRDPPKLSASDETPRDVGRVRSEDRPAAAPKPAPMPAPMPSPVRLRPQSEEARDRFRATLAKTLEKRGV